MRAVWPIVLLGCADPSVEEAAPPRLDALEDAWRSLAGRVLQLDLEPVADAVATVRASATEWCPEPVVFEDGSAGWDIDCIDGDFRVFGRYRDQFDAWPSPARDEARWLPVDRDGGDVVSAWRRGFFHVDLPEGGVVVVNGEFRTHRVVWDDLEWERRVLGGPVQSPSAVGWAAEGLVPDLVWERRGDELVVDGSVDGFDGDWPLLGVAELRVGDCIEGTYVAREADGGWLEATFDCEPCATVTRAGRVRGEVCLGAGDWEVP
jgi:hypothetical protein